MSDAVVIGAGPNGLVGANLLVDAGWDVVLLEANDEIGGAVRSSTEVDASFVHDTFSSFYPLADPASGWVTACRTSASTESLTFIAHRPHRGRNPFRT